MYEEFNRRASDKLAVKRFDACYRVLDVRYDPCFPDEIVIEGIRYDVGTFVNMGPGGMDEGEIFKLEKRAKDGVVWISRITHESVLEEARRLFNREVFDAAVGVELDRLRNRTAWQRFKERFTQPSRRK